MYSLLLLDCRVGALFWFRESSFLFFLIFFSIRIQKKKKKRNQRCTHTKKKKKNTTTTFVSLFFFSSFPPYSLMTSSTSPLPLHSLSPLPRPESSRREVSEELGKDAQSTRVLSTPSSPVVHPNGSFFTSSSLPLVDPDETKAIEERNGGEPFSRTHEAEKKNENHLLSLPPLQDTCFSTPHKKTKNRGNGKHVPHSPPLSSSSVVLSPRLSHPPVLNACPVVEENVPHERHLSLSSISASTHDTPLAPWRTSVLAVVNPLSGERGAVKHLLRELCAVLGKERVHVLNAETFAHPETLGQHILDTALFPRYPPPSSSSSNEKKKKEDNASSTPVSGGGRSDVRGTVVVAGGDGTISFVYGVLGRLMAAALPSLHLPSSSSSSSRAVDAVERPTDEEERGSGTAASGYSVPPPPPGAVGWYLPALSPIPLGTGNDYANCMGFGAHYSGGKIWDHHHSRPPPPPPPLSSSPKDKSSVSSSVVMCCGEEDKTVVRKEVKEEEAVVEVSEKKRRRGGGLLTAPCYPFDVWTVSFFSLSVVQTVASAVSNRTRFSSSSPSGGGGRDGKKKKEEEEPPQEVSTSAAPPSFLDAVHFSSSDSFSTLTDVLGALDWAEVERLQKIEVDARKAQHQQWKEEGSIRMPLSTTREEEEEEDAKGVHHSPPGHEFIANASHRRRTKKREEAKGGAAAANRAAPPPLLPPARMSFINYVGIGFDAYVTAKFDQIRRAHPKFCNTRMANKLTYGVQSIAAAVRCTTLPALIPMVCVMPPFFSSSPFGHAPTTTTTSEEEEEDVGEAVPRTKQSQNDTDVNGRQRQPPWWTAVGLPGSSKALVITNVDSYAAGCKPWGSSHSYAPPHDGASTASPPSPKTTKTVQWKKGPPYTMVHIEKKMKENDRTLQEVLVREKQTYRYTISDSSPPSSSPPISFPLSAGLPAFHKAAIDDGLLEVQCMNGIVHYANLQLRLTTANRLAQASELIIFVLCTPMDVLLPTVGTQSPYSKKAFREVRERLQKTTKKHTHVTIPSLHVQVDGEAVTPIQEAMIIRVTRARDVVWGRCARKSVVSRESL